MVDIVCFIAGLFVVCLCVCVWGGGFGVVVFLNIWQGGGGFAVNFIVLLLFVFCWFLNK